MDYSFDKTRFVCVATPRGPQVLEVDVSTKLSTVHPVSEYDTEDAADLAAKTIDPTWQAKLIFNKIN